MKLQKQLGRKTKGVVRNNPDYSKFVIVIPNKIIKLINWKGGETLKCTITKANNLLIKVDN